MISRALVILFLGSLTTSVGASLCHCSSPVTANSKLLVIRDRSKLRQTEAIGRHAHDDPVARHVERLAKRDAHFDVDRLGKADLGELAAPLVLGVDRFLDMCRTMLNVSGDLAIATMVAGRDPDAPSQSGTPCPT